MPETQWMTLTETADMMKTLPEKVTQMCEDGKLEYYMEDGIYFVSRESIDLYMHSPISQSAPAIPDANGTPRRQYGRAPHETEPSPESAYDSQAASGPDEVDADSGLEPEDSMEETPGRGIEETPGRGMEETPGRGMEETPGRGMEETPGRGDEVVEAAEGAQPVEDLAAEGTRPVDEPAVTDDLAASEDPETSEDLVEAAEDAQFAEAAADPDPGEPDVSAAEIIADLRAALSRHAREHKAFCDEIAALADALETTLSHNGDQTSELTREISSLLARYTRR